MTTSWEPSALKTGEVAGNKREPRRSQSPAKKSVPAANPSQDDNKAQQISGRRGNSRSK